MKPLAGVKIVELARVLAGPWCGQLLADLGAEVVKIERPGVGDDTRHWGPPFLADACGENLGAAYYHSANRGKTNVAIDISSVDGQEAVRALVRQSDILIENYKVGALAKYGLDHYSLLAVKDDLITCSITGFGQDGPYAQHAGYDYVIQGMSGFMSVNGEPDGTPLKAGVPYADIFTGVYSAVAILSALHRRNISGKGAHIDMALLDVQMGVLANQALGWMISGQIPERMGNGHAHLVPYQSFAALDGDIIIAVGNDHQFRRLCQILGLAIEGDTRFTTNSDRVAHRMELIALLSPAIAKWRKLDLGGRLEEAGISSGPINRIDEAFADPQVIHRGMQIAPQGIPGLASPIVIDRERMVSPIASPPQTKGG